jgi:chemotaxis signal transduction protein
MAGAVKMADKKKVEGGKGKKKVASSARKSSSSKSSIKQSASETVSKKTAKKANKKKVTNGKKSARKKITNKITESPQAKPEDSKIQPEGKIPESTIEEYSTYSTFMDNADESTKLVEFLVFTLLDKQYAFDIHKIEEILHARKATYVPRTNGFVTGIITVRGRIVPIIDITGLIKSGEVSDYAMREKIVILKSESGPVGVRMNRSMEIVMVPEDSVKPSPGHLVDEDEKFISGIIKVQEKFVSVLNTDTLLSVQAARGAHEGEA